MFTLYHARTIIQANGPPMDVDTTKRRTWPPCEGETARCNPTIMRDRARRRPLSPKNCCQLERLSPRSFSHFGIGKSLECARMQGMTPTVIWPMQRRTPIASHLLGVYRSSFHSHQNDALHSLFLSAAENLRDSSESCVRQ
jgi:hypothetical protein